MITNDDLYISELSPLPWDCSILDVFVCVCHYSKTNECNVVISCPGQVLEGDYEMHPVCVHGCSMRQLVTTAFTHFWLLTCLIKVYALYFV